MRIDLSDGERLKLGRACRNGRGPEDAFVEQGDPQLRDAKPMGVDVGYECSELLIGCRMGFPRCAHPLDGRMPESVVPVCRLPPALALAPALGYP